MLVATGIAKRFGAVTALADVALALAPGRIHGLLGENGAGKSTLMHILAGLVRADAGAVAWREDGRAAHPIRSARMARDAGIGLVHQHSTLVPSLSVLDNCVLAHCRGPGPVDRAALRARLLALAARTGLRVDPEARAGALAVGQQQRVEILKALLDGGRVLMLDEPTAVLAPQEVDELIPALRELAHAGTAVAFTSHKLAEVERLCDEVTILRRGRIAHAGARAGLSRARMAELMLGAAPPASAPAPAARTRGPLRLELVGLSVRGALHGVDLRVHAGETVGIAGVDGNGQAPLIGALLGLVAPGAGTLAVHARRVGVIPDDRQREALVMPMSVRDNLLLRDGRRPPYATAGWRRARRWAAQARRLIARYDVRPSAPDAPVATLSGGNQQKVVIARELHAAPELVIAVNPTRGLDLGAAAAVWAELARARAAGAGVLLIHADLDELLAVADRVLVLGAGRLCDSGWPASTRAAIGRLMLDDTPVADGARAHA